MSWSRVLRWQPQQSIAFGSIGASYSDIGTMFFYETRILTVYNGTDALLQFSTNGVQDQFVVPANGTMIIDIATNDFDEVPTMLPAKLQFSIKQIGVPTSGSVYIMSLSGFDL
jgi:hypothetical protein